MKFLIAGIVAALFATSTEAIGQGNIRNLAVQNCRTHNAAGACTECIFRYVLQDGACKKVSDQCKTFNTTTGDCLSCFDGWNLDDGACVLPGGPVEPEDPVDGCIEYDSNGCKACEYRRVRISGSECRKVSDQCNTWNASNGACTSCYSGWTLSNGQCLA